MNKCRKIVPGSVLGIICPSGHPSTIEQVNKFCNLLTEHGYRYKLGKSVTAVEGYLAGSDALRAEDLMDMFEDNSVDAILCFKGGYGAQRKLPYLDFEKIKKYPKLLMGFSDVTILLNTLNQFADMPTVHGEMGVCMQQYEEFTFNHFFETLSNGFVNPLKNPTLPLNIINEGAAEGIVVGGNLSLIYALMGTPYEINFDDKILFIEELGFESSPARVSSYLYYMKQNGVFDKIKGLWIGNYEHPSGYTLEKIVFDVLGNDFDFPIIKSNNFGHVDKKTVVPIGSLAKIDTSLNKKIILIENCVN